MSVASSDGLEPQIDRWRAYLLAHGTSETDVAAAESRLREQLGGLSTADLDESEAFLVALRRLASDHQPTRDFARSYATGLWAEGSDDVATAQGGTADGGTHRVLGRPRLCGRRGARDQGSCALRTPVRCGGFVLRSQPEPLRSAVPRPLLHLEARAEHQGHRRSLGGVCGGRRVRQRVPVRSGGFD